MKRLVLGLLVSTNLFASEGNRDISNDLDSVQVVNTAYEDIYGPINWDDASLELTKDGYILHVDNSSKAVFTASVVIAARCAAHPGCRAIAVATGKYILKGVEGYVFGKVLEQIFEGSW